MRLDKRRLTTALGNYLVNPLVKLAVALGVAPPSYAILETTGRKSGKPRRGSDLLSVRIDLDPP